MEGIEVSDALGKELQGSAILVGCDPGPQERKPEEPPWSPKESLDELEALCKSLDVEVRERMLQQWRPGRGTVPLGRGKIEELRDRIAADPDIGVVVFDCDLSIKALISLKGRLSPDGGCVILDRTSLILRIFAARAKSSEAKLQVTLASQQYMLPRLRYFLTEGGGLESKGGSAAGSSQGGSAGAALRGKGETQLSMDKSMLRGQMCKVRKKLLMVRALRVERRAKTNAIGLPVIALVGYTNAGKSTLLNRLCGSVEVEAQDRLFQTLDPTRRRVELPNGRGAFVVDTVGFLQRLPEQLVAGFRATLEEIEEADIVLHVVDVCSSTMYKQVGTVQQTLRELKTYDVKTPQILVFNKADKLEEGAQPELQQSIDFPWPGVVGHVQISARTGKGMASLAEAIENTLCEFTDFGAERMRVMIPWNDASSYAKLRGPPPLVKIEREEHTEEGYLVDCTCSTSAARRLRKFQVEAPDLDLSATAVLEDDLGAGILVDMELDFKVAEMEEEDGEGELEDFGDMDDLEDSDDEDLDDLEDEDDLDNMDGMDGLDATTAELRPRSDEPKPELELARDEVLEEEQSPAASASSLGRRAVTVAKPVWGRQAGRGRDADRQGTKL